MTFARIIWPVISPPDSPNNRCIYPTATTNHCIHLLNMYRDFGAPNSIMRGLKVLGNTQAGTNEKRPHHHLLATHAAFVLILGISQPKYHGCILSPHQITWKIETVHFVSHRPAFVKLRHVNGYSYTVMNIEHCQRDRRWRFSIMTFRRLLLPPNQATVSHDVTSGTSHGLLQNSVRFYEPGRKFQTICNIPPRHRDDDTYPNSPIFSKRQRYNMKETGPIPLHERLFKSLLLSLIRTLIWDESSLLFENRTTMSWWSIEMTTILFLDLLNPNETRLYQT